MSGPATAKLSHSHANHLLMNAKLGFDLHQLREIGQSDWDVIAALGRHAPPPAEKDPYLVRAAELVCAGADDAKAADYIIDVSAEQLGVDTGSGIRERAWSFAAAIRCVVERS